MRYERCVRQMGRRQADRSFGTIGGQEIQRSRRMIELENEVKALRNLLHQVVCYVDRGELSAINQIPHLTPPLSKLRVIAMRNPPPAEWYDDDT